MTISENISLASYTTFKVGGKARYFCVAASESDLSEALVFARKKGVSVFVLGGGSNIVISDEGFAGLVIKMEIRGASRQGDVVTAGAGENWDALVAKTVEWGMWGLENLSAIPGTVGAAPVQNIGAYGAEAKDAIESVRAIDSLTGAARAFSNAECRFAYRESFFKTPEGKKWIIVSVAFRLSSSPRPNLSYKDLKEYFAARANAAKAPSQSEIRDAVIAIRSGKFPDLSVIGTAGSFWKNPIIPRMRFEELSAKYLGMPSFPAGEDANGAPLVKVPLAWILDKACGLKGSQKGNVGLFENQPLVLVAKTGATAGEIRDFATKIAAAVKEKTGIDIELEAVFLA